jgi:hypothetical protein
VARRLLYVFTGADAIEFVGHGEWSRMV